jgi:sugar lactone lactonase YvrE
MRRFVHITAYLAIMSFVVAPFRLFFLFVVFQASETASRPALGEELQYPLAVAAHGDTLYLADRNLPGIWKSEGGKLSVYFQASKKYRTPLNAPRCLTVDKQGILYAGDSSTREVYRFDGDGNPQPLTAGTIGIPMGIAVTGQGDLLISDLERHRLWKVTLSDGKEPAVEKYVDLQAPAGICLDAQAQLWVVSRGDNALLKVSPEKKVEVVVAGRFFEFPNDVAIDPQGTAYVSDGYAKAIWRISGGKPETWVEGAPLVGPVGLLWHNDHLLVTDPRAKAVFQIDAEGKLLAVDLGEDK